MQVVPVVMISRPVSIALRRVTVNFTRDGSQTSSLKSVVLLTPGVLTTVAVFNAFDGVTSSQDFVAEAVDGEWLLMAFDTAVPRRAAARYPRINADVTFALDLSESGTGGGQSALLAARVQVDDVPAQRSVVAVEQLTDGEWRVAGHARTEADGEVDLDLRVSGSGKVYALGLDDWGVQFQAGQLVVVGDTIRPTLFQGLLYRISQAGQLPSTEPAWWDETQAGPQPLGTARAEVVRYYQPQAHGPVPVEIL